TCEYAPTVIEPAPSFVNPLKVTVALASRSFATFKTALLSKSMNWSRGSFESIVADGREVTPVNTTPPRVANVPGPLRYPWKLVDGTVTVVEKRVAVLPASTDIVPPSIVTGRAIVPFSVNS